MESLIKARNMLQQELQELHALEYDRGISWRMQERAERVHAELDDIESHIDSVQESMS